MITSRLNSLNPFSSVPVFTLERASTKSFLVYHIQTKNRFSKTFGGENFLGHTAEDSER